MICHNLFKMKKRYILGTIAIILILVVLGIIFFINQYRIGGGTDRSLDCINYYKECNCMGFVKIFESYPPKYECVGLEFCDKINVTECRGG